MGDRRSAERLSVRQMLLMFIAGVLVCAVFFALGFLVGYNQRAPGAASETEQIPPPSAVPPAVNPPADTPVTSQVASPSAAPSASQSGTDAGEPETKTTGGQLPAAPAKAPKRAEAAKPTAEGESRPAASKPAGGLMLQVIASRSQTYAQSLVSVLKTRGYTVFLVSPKEAHAGDKLWRVLVGPFRTRRQAEQAQHKLTQQGYHPFIKH